MWAHNQPNDIWDADVCTFCCSENCYDKTCQKGMSSLCLFDGQRPILELRGLCNESVLDHLYYPASQSGDFFWIGATRGTVITYNQTTFQWMARLYGEPNIYAVAGVSFQSLLLGKSTWTVSNDRGCSSSKDFRVNVSLSSCKAHEFACDDGRCVGLAARCDGTATCPDGSDEVDCRIVQMTALYNRNIAAPNTTVHVLVHIRDVLDIDVRGGRVRILAQLTLNWRDLRLSFTNLKEKVAVNTLSQEEYEGVWRPFLIYANMEPTVSRLVEEPVITVCREGNKTLSGLEKADRAEIYAGHENSLQWSETSRYRQV
jgi:hypothetical protein